MTYSQGGGAAPTQNEMVVCATPSPACVCVFEEGASYRSWLSSCSRH